MKYVSNVDGAKTGMNYRLVRISQRLTLKGLAKKSGVSYATLSRLEGGKIRTSFDTYAQVAKALNFAPDKLIVAKK